MEPGRTGPDRAALTSALPQHPIAVRVDVPVAPEPPGASRFSRSLAERPRGLEPHRRARAGRCARCAACTRREAGPGAETVPTVRLRAPVR
ncbi:hypothetical protein EYF80_051883 [Liparis tanakae]|uniref:Uncharacterized protein n=1 Tax=Liparis tanakae TaxID=230148 RepID=A0A4Z2FAW5_9TELE|nr:hypothetical protein EYF80_051883 [Liparis tanakae]